MTTTTIHPGATIQQILEALLAALREAAGAGTSAPHRDTSAPVRPDVARLAVR